MSGHEPGQPGLALCRDLHPDEAAVGLILSSLDQVGRLGAIDQLDSAVMARADKDASDLRPAGALVRWARAVVPGGFAIAMATGIVSAATRGVGAADLSAALLIVTAASFVIVLTASALRAAWYPADLVADLSQPSRSFTCFAFIAACDVLAADLAGEGRGSRFAVRHPRWGDRGVGSDSGVGACVDIHDRHHRKPAWPPRPGIRYTRVYRDTI